MRSRGRPDDSDQARLRVVLIAVSMAMFLVELDFFAFNVALPAMVADLRTTSATMQWAISGYQLSFAAFLIAGGRLGDIFGRRRILLAGLSVFGGSAAICGMAPSASIVIAFRVGMGLGGALTFPAAIAVLSNAFRGPGQARALAIAYGVAAIGYVVGPFVGGGLTEALSWRWVFFAMVPLALGPMLLIRRYVHESRDESVPRKLDLGGLATVSGGIAATTFAIDRGQAWGWVAPETLAVFFGGIALFGVFVAIERKVRWPLIDLRLFRNRAFNVVVASTTVSNVALVTMMFVATLYLQQVRGLGPLAAGLVFVGPALGAGVGGLAAGPLAERVRAEWILVCANAAGAAGVLGLGLPVSPGVYAAAFTLAGIGFGLGWAYVSVGTQAVTDRERAGEASGVSLTFLVGLAGFGVVAASSAVTEMGQHGVGPGRAMQIVNLALAALAGAAALWVAVFGRRMLRDTRPTSE